jgi:hypothetical protein
MEDHPSYWAVLPANVRYDERLCPNAKILYSEISALQNTSDGYSWASNGYFSNLYQVDPATVGAWVKQLQEAGHIACEMQTTATGVRRIIRLTSLGGSPGKAGHPPGGSPGKAGEGSPGKAGHPPQGQVLTGQGNGNGNGHLTSLTLNNLTLNTLHSPEKAPLPHLVKKERKDKDVREFTDYYQELFMGEYEGAKPTWDGKIMKLVRADIGRLGVEVLGSLVQVFFEEPTDFVQKNGTGMGYNIFHSQIDGLLERRRRTG